MRLAWVISSSKARKGKKKKVTHLRIWDNIDQAGPLSGGNRACNTVVSIR